MGNSIPIYRKFVGTAGGMFVGSGLSMLSGVLSARFLGPEQFGLYSFALAIIAIAAVPVISGMPNLLIREIANFYLEKKWSLLKGVIYWSRMYVVVMSFIVIGIIYLGIYLNFFHASNVDLLWLAALLIPLKGILVQQGSILNGFRKPVLAQLPNKIFLPFLTIFFLVLYIFLGIPLTGEKLIYIAIVSSFIAVLISVFLLFQNTKLSSNTVKPEYKIKEWHSSLLPFSLMAIISTLNTELASVFVGWSVDNKSVAYFKVGMHAVTLISLSLSSVNAIIMPNIARLHRQNNMQGAQDLLTKSVRLSCLISLPIIIFLIIFGKFTIGLLFGEEYLSAYPLLVVLCAGQLFNVLMGSVGLVLNMTGHEKSALKSLIIALIVNVILLLFLVPFYGAIGAAIAVSISLICWNILMAISVFKLINLKTWLC